MALHGVLAYKLWVNWDASLCCPFWEVDLARGDCYVYKGGVFDYCMVNEVRTFFLGIQTKFS